MISKLDTLLENNLRYCTRMKYIIFTLLFIFSSGTITAQDTLYVKGKRKPLIVNITVVKKNSLNYTTEDGGLVRTVKMKNVRKIKFYKTTDTTGSTEEVMRPISVVETIPAFDEFRSTISINSIGSWRYYGGLNYLYHLENMKSKNERHHYLINIGGGYYNRRIGFALGDPEFINRAKGYYLEFGLRLEINSPRNSKSRFHIGLDVNNRWVERTIISFFNQRNEVSNVSEFSVQVPLGYTYRSSNGFYFTTGIEVTTEKLFPAAHIGVGVAFGK